MTVSRDNYAEQNARLSGAAIQRARGSNAGIEEESFVPAAEMRVSPWDAEKIFSPSKRLTWTRRRKDDESEQEDKR